VGFSLLRFLRAFTSANDGDDGVASLYGAASPSGGANGDAANPGVANALLRPIHAYLAVSLK
jgi:hypothetical protein